MDFAKPQKEHEWLQQLVGDWTFEHECPAGPDQPPIKSEGTESYRSLGGLWFLGEGKGSVPGGGTSDSLFTLGYDPAKKCFVGSFICSVMSNLWVYENGALDASGKKLVLEAEGPSFVAEGKTAKYKDSIEFKSADHRTLTSQYQGDDGHWHEFMVANYWRRK